MPTELSTHGWPQPERQARWAEAISDTYFPLSLEFAAGQPFDGHLQRWSTPSTPLSLSRLRNVYSDNLLEVTEWCMSLDPLARPQSVFALQKELARETERRYTKLSFSERMKLQFESLKTGAKT